MLEKFEAHGCGFTLIELLTVIAVVGILAAILLPVIGNARRTAQASQCVSNLRHMQLANQMYASENNGIYLSPVNFDEEGKANGQWPNNTKYKKLLASVSEGTAKKWGFGTWPDELLCPATHAIGSPDAGKIQANYGLNRAFNDHFGFAWGTEGQSWGLRRTQIENPSKTVAFADSTDWLLKRVIGYDPDDEANNGLNTRGYLAFRHDGIAHAVNFDASVDSYTAEDMNDPDIVYRFTLERE